MSEVNLCITGI